MCWLSWDIKYVTQIRETVQYIKRVFFKYEIKETNENIKPQLIKQPAGEPVGFSYKIYNKKYSLLYMREYFLI